MFGDGAKAGDCAGAFVPREARDSYQMKGETVDRDNAAQLRRTFDCCCQGCASE